MAHPELSFATIDPSRLSDGGRHLRAKQLNHFMEHEVNPYYGSPKSEGGLGLTYIDSEPLTIGDRIRRLMQAGFVQEAGLEYIIGYHPNEDGHIPHTTDAIKGLAVLSKPNGYCKDTVHAPTEIVEFDLAKDYRNRGLGVIMLGEVLERIHPEDQVQLDVAQDNRRARDFYARAGLRDDPHTPLIQHGVWDVYHRRMYAPAEYLIANLPQTS